LNRVYGIFSVDHRNTSEDQSADLQCLTFLKTIRLFIFDMESCKCRCEACDYIEMTGFRQKLEKFISEATKVCAFRHDEMFQLFLFEFQQVTSVIDFIHMNCQFTPSNCVSTKAPSIHRTLSSEFFHMILKIPVFIKNKCADF